MAPYGGGAGSSFVHHRRQPSSFALTAADHRLPYDFDEGGHRAAESGSGIYWDETLLLAPDAAYNYYPPFTPRRPPDGTVHWRNGHHRHDDRQQHGLSIMQLLSILAETIIQYNIYRPDFYSNLA